MHKRLDSIFPEKYVRKTSVKTIAILAASIPEVRPGEGRIPWNRTACFIVSLNVMV